MGLQQGAAVAADLPWRGAAGLAHTPHQLDGCRGADLKALSRLPSRTARLNRADNPATQILGQRCCHREPHCSRPRHPGIKTPESVQLKNALVGPLVWDLV